MTGEGIPAPAGIVEPGCTLAGAARPLLQRLPADGIGRGQRDRLRGSVLIMAGPIDERTIQKKSIYCNKTLTQAASSALPPRLGLPLHRIVLDELDDLRRRCPCRWPARSPRGPGEEFTSIDHRPVIGAQHIHPRDIEPKILRAARIAIERSSGVILTGSAVPPRWRLERNSPGLPLRFIAATTLPPITSARMSCPLASLMNSCTRMLHVGAAERLDHRFGRLGSVSPSTTPMPCVPSSSLITSGAPPTILQHLRRSASVDRGRRR